MRATYRDQSIPTCFYQIKFYLLIDKIYQEQVCATVDR